MSPIKSMIRDLVISETRNMIEKLRAVVNFAEDDQHRSLQEPRDLTAYACEIYPYLQKNIADLIESDNGEQVIALLSKAGIDYTVAYKEPRLYLPRGYYICTQPVPVNTNT